MGTNTEIIVDPGNVQTIERFESTETLASPNNMLLIAIKNNYEIEKIKMLMDMQLQWEANEARKAYVAAMAEFKKNPPKIYKDSSVDFTSQRTGAKTSYNYASIGNVTEILTKALAEHGFSANWDVKQDKQANWIEVSCKLTHAQGHSESVTMGGPPDTSGNKNTIQSWASAQTYLQRYTLLAATGMATNESETDGRNPHVNNGKGSDQQKPVAAAPENEAIAKMKTEAVKTLNELKRLEILSEDKYKKSLGWFRVAKKEAAIKEQLAKITAMLPPDQQPEELLSDKIGKMILQLAGNDTVKASKILKDAIIFYNTRIETEGKLDVISSRKQIKEEQAQGILQAIELYRKEVVEKKNGNGVKPADQKPVTQQPVNQSAAEKECAI